MSIKNLYYIEQIDNSIAIKVVIEHHYLHRRPPAIISYGLFERASKKLVGVIIYGNPTSPSAVTSLFIKPENINVYELNRLWIQDNTPKNSESYFISNTMKLLNREVILSFSDPSHGHNGTIYQACNFLYLGITKKNKDLKIKNKEHLSSNNANIKEYQEKYGAENVYYADREQKHRYVYLNCNEKRKKELIANFKFNQLPYPKSISKYLIYGLKDPVINEIKYIGKSEIGLRRPNQHKKPSSLKTNTPKNLWIKELIKNNLMYSIEIIEQLPDNKELISKEIFWIKWFKDKGFKLLNGTDGGEGTPGYKHTEKTKEILSQKRKQYHENNEIDPKLYESCYKRKEHKLIDNVYYKHCSDCETFRKLEEYSKDLARWDGIRSICIFCARKRKAIHYEQTATKLTKEQWKLSYSNRKNNMRLGVKLAYEKNPSLKTNLSKKMSKAIYAVNILDNSIIEFESALHAKKSGFNNSNIGVAIKHKKQYKGYMWFFKKQ